MLYSRFIRAFVVLNVPHFCCKVNVVMDVRGPWVCVGVRGVQVVIVAWDIVVSFVQLAEWWSLAHVDPECRRRMRRKGR
jgi:hypothetical protein